MDVPFQRTRVPSIAIVAFAIAIFIVDARVDADIDIPVLYVAVVLMSARLYEVRGILTVALGCAVLSVVGDLLSPGAPLGTTAIANRLLSLSAIGVTTALAVRNRTVQRAMQKAQAELAHVARVTTLSELSASIAHEVNQPLAAVVTNAEACARWLDRGTPDLDEARCAVERVIKNGIRASEVIRHVSALSKKTDTQKAPLDINLVVNEVIALVNSELVSHRVLLRMELAPALPTVLADRVQLQQVVINLVMNGI